MIIRKINDNKIEVKKIVEIHINAFENFFLTFMGKGFLYQMYASYISHKDSDILVAVSEQGEVLGFLAYSAEHSGLYKHMIKTRLIPFMWYSLVAFLKKPKVFMRLVRALLKPSEVRREENYIELASIGVLPQEKSNGVGSKLVEALKERIDFAKFKYITLETDAVNNEGANHFYQKNGFILEREFETNEGRKMFEYRYYGEE